MAETEKAHLYPDELAGLLDFMSRLPTDMGSVADAFGPNDWKDGKFEIKDFRDGIRIDIYFDHEAENWYAEIYRED